ncbi:hypothetical protein K501DRAFT_334839 [Backusella circina FSU 941]|nr:hypothetical protein K501DRAFT_334839 [Backusella circina FSU 941]
MLSRFTILMCVAFLVYIALASPMGDLQKKASSTISVPISTKVASSAPTPKTTAAAIYPDYSKITSKKTDPLNDGWKGMADQASGTEFCVKGQDFSQVNATGYLHVLAVVLSFFFWSICIECSSDAYE